MHTLLSRAPDRAVPSSKSAVLEALAAGDVARCREIIAAITADPACTAGDYFFLAKCLENNEAIVDGKPVKVAVLSSFAMKGIAQFLSVKLFVDGYKGKLYFCPYGQHEQEVLDASSGLYAFGPDFVLLFLRIQDLVPDVFYEIQRGEVNLDAMASDLVSVIESLVSRIAAQARGGPPTVLLHAFDYPRLSVRQASTCRVGSSAKAFIDKLNGLLRDVAARHPGVKYFDYNYFTYLHGHRRVYDENLWLMTQNPIPPEQYPHLASEYIRYFRARSGETYKCIAVDADNTLWGGVVAEDGFEGIQVGVEYPGSVYREFQKLLLDYRSKGILLLLLSKNEEQDVLSVLRQHPGMVLREEHFSMIRANWRPKPENLLDCCQELNLGVDSVVFVDDSPVERELMRARLPGVLTLELPKRPEFYKETLLATPILEKDEITDEDRRRGDMYASELKRKSLRKSAGSLEEFYRGLQMKLTIERADAFSLSRLATLTRRTNQFNLTTKRYSTEELERLVHRRQHDLYGLRVVDRFGDNGLVGLCIVEKGADGEAWSIDTFLLSCRVLGRTVEDVFFSHVLEQARAAGVRRVIGQYVPTERNAQVREFYARFAFVQDGPRAAQGAAERWVGAVETVTLLKHPWFEVVPT